MNLCLTSPVKYCWILLKKSITHCTGSWPGFLPGPGTPPPKNPPVGSKFPCQNPLSLPNMPFMWKKTNVSCFWMKLCMWDAQPGPRSPPKRPPPNMAISEGAVQGWQLMAWRPIPYRKSNRFKYRIHLEHNYDYIRDSKQFIYHKWYPHFNASEDPISYACLHPAGSFCAWRYSTSSNFQVSKGWFRMSCKMVGST